MSGGTYHSQGSQAAIPEGRVGDVQLLQHGQPRCSDRMVGDPLAALHTNALISAQHAAAREAGSNQVVQGRLQSPVRHCSRQPA